MRRKFVRIGVAAAIAGCVLLGVWLRSQWRVAEPVGGDGPGTGAVRPAVWAEPIAREGLPNFHRVADGLYRGAQPTAAGFKELKALGVKTVVNLRSFNSDRDELGDTGLGYEHITMKAWHPERKEIVRFLQIVTDKERAPVFVHCQHGADRTGTMCAIYRIAIEGWSKDDARAEMTGGGFGFHPTWKNLLEYVRDLDVDEIKREAGL